MSPTKLLQALSVVAALAALGNAGSEAAPSLDPAKALTQFDVDTWTMSDGLPENSVTAVVQTRDGYLWLGTFGGLARFDGVRFEVFTSGNTPALRSGGVNALLEDRDGSLWIGTNGGGLTRLQAGVFTTFTTADGLAHDIVRALFQDRHGDLWVGTNDGLSRLSAGRFTRFGAAQGLTNGVVRAIQEDRAGRLWVGTNGGGLCRLAGERFEALGVKDGLPSDSIFALHEDHEGALWIGTDGGGLARFADGRFARFGRRDGLPSEVVWTIREDPGGSLWIGTHGGGLARYRDGRFESLTRRNGLSTDFVRALWPDREGSLWVGTYTGGLCRLRDGKFTVFASSEGLAHDFARTVLEDRRGDLWVGTTGGGLCRLGAPGVRCWGARDGLGDDIRALEEDAQGRLWVGASGAGLLRKDATGFTRVGAGAGLPHPNVTAILNDGVGGLWVGTNGGGVCRLRDGRFAECPGAGQLALQYVMALFQDRSGALWVGSDGHGLSRVAAGAVTTYTQRDGLASDIVFCLHQDADGALWIGTSAGLSRLKDGVFRSFGERDGLLDDVVFRVLEDAHGGLWLSGNKGISRVARRELDEVAAGLRERVRAVGYGTADGLKSAACSGVAQPAGWRRRDGTLWFPTTRGVVRVDPEHIPRNLLPPPVHVESLVVDGRPVAPADEVELPPGSGRWEIHYTALSLLAPEKVRFRYRLEGVDADWVEAGTRRAAYYTRIAPGAYTFRVIAANNDGVWNETGARVVLTLRPHWHETPLFSATLFAALALAVAGAWRLRTRRLEGRRLELEAMVQARTSDLVAEQQRTEAALEEADRERRHAEQADAFKTELLSIAAHDLKSPLQSMLGYSDLAQASADDPGLVRKYSAASASAAERMIELIDRILDSAAIDAGRLALERRPLDLATLARAAVDGWRARAEAKGQSLSLDAAAGCHVEGDRGRLLQVVENLVSNAVKYSPRDGAIRVSVAPVGARVRLEVRDAGPGLTEQDRQRLFGRFQRLSARPTGGESSNGLGLSIVKQLVELHGGQVGAASAGPGTGAVFFVELPAAPLGDRPLPRGA